MEKFIPYEKLSKKKQRELNAARRGTWTINPVTRKPANPKAYNRKTARKWKDDSHSVPFVSVFAPLETKRRVIVALPVARAICPPFSVAAHSVRHDPAPRKAQASAARATWPVPSGRTRTEDRPRQISQTHRTWGSPAPQLGTIYRNTQFTTRDCMKE